MNMEEESGLPHECSRELGFSMLFPPTNKKYDSQNVHFTVEYTRLLKIVACIHYYSIKSCSLSQAQQVKNTHTILLSHWANQKQHSAAFTATENVSASQRDSTLFPSKAN
jgi:hypothetical protein